jgi:hypothetical protein
MPDHTLHAETGHYNVSGEDINFTLWKKATQPGSEVRQTDPKIQFFFHLGFAINRWAYIERDLYEIFRYALATDDEAKAAYLFHRAFGIKEHFKMTDNLIARSLSAENLITWEKIKTDLLALIDFRNRLAHEPSISIVSAAMDADEESLKRIPPPAWELHEARSKVLGKKKSKSAPPVTTKDIIGHIESVMKLEEAISQFRSSLPKRPDP